MNKYKSSGQLKGIAKDQLFGHYGTAIGALLLVGIITLIITGLPDWFVSANSIPELIIYYLISFIISLFTGIFSSGEAFLYLKLTCGQPVSVKDVFSGFQVYPDKAIVLQLVFSTLAYIAQVPMMIFYYLFLTTGQVNIVSVHFLCRRFVYCDSRRAYVFPGLLPFAGFPSISREGPAENEPADYEGA